MIFLEDFLGSDFVLAESLSNEEPFLVLVTGELRLQSGQVLVLNVLVVKPRYFDNLLH